MGWRKPMAGKELPEPLRGSDGLREDAPPEDVFTQDTIAKRMPKILDSVLAKMPSALVTEAVRQGVKELQAEMRGDAPLRLLQSDAQRVNAEAWNSHLAEYVDRGERWQTAPWWLVENYMYKRLLEELEKNSETAAYDPFEPVKMEALKDAEATLSSLDELLDFTTSCEQQVALEAVLLRSLWGNQADLSLSGGEVVEVSGGALDQLLSDHRALALQLLTSARQVILVLDNHGLEVLCDLVLVDTLLRLTEATVTLHVKDSPVFVSDVTESNVPQVLQWLEPRLPDLARRLQEMQSSGRLKVKAHEFYTSGRAFWELPEDLAKDYAEAVVVLKGDANYRRLLGDLHWPYDTDFAEYASSFWQGEGLISLRTMKSGVALGVPAAEQRRAREESSEWLTSGKFGQVLAFQR